MINVLHLDTEMTWRGGENQIRLLIEALPKNQFVNYLAAHKDSAIAQKNIRGAELIHINMSGILSYFWVRKLARFCHSRNIQIIDAHSSRAHSLALALKKQLPNLKLVVHRRVDYLPGSNYFSKRKYLNTQIDAYVAISMCIAKVLEDYGINSKRITTIPSSINVKPQPTSDAKITSFREQLPFNTQVPLIASIGYLTTQKGHDLLLDALAVLKEQGSNFCCVIAGDGPLRKALEAQRKHLKLENYLIFLGIRDDVPTILAAASILAMPSNYEGLGTTILDSLLANCCVVATNVGGIPEMIKHQETGLLSPKGDAEGFAANLREALEAPQLRLRLSTKGKELITRNHAVETMASNTATLYKKLMRNSAR